MRLSNGKQGKISPLSPKSPNPKAMRSTTIASTATAFPSKPTASTEEDRDSCYFPGCRKDANCCCEICIASINATLDLMPLSIQKSSLTRLTTASGPPALTPEKVDVTPISFGSLSTPTSRSTRAPPAPSPCLRSSGRTGPKGTGKMVAVAEKETGFGGVSFTRAVLVLAMGLMIAVEFGLSWGAPRVLKPAFSSAGVRKIGERSGDVKGLDGKLRFLQRSLQSLGVGKVSNCSYANSRWEISQDGLLLNSHCKLYKSSTEEIRIWGWPLQTAGLLVTGFSSRSFTIISGGVTEWPEGKAGFVTRASNSSWTHWEWSSSAVQFNPNTWVLEYRRSSILENPSLASAALALLKHRVSRKIVQMRQKLWLLTAFGKSQYHSFGAKAYVQVPPT